MIRIPVAAPRFSSLYGKIFFLTVSLVALVVIVLFLFVNNTNRGFAQSRIESDLATGERVIREVLDEDQFRLVLASRVLAADFGLREALATRDEPTILSALLNHASRIEAPIALVTDLDGIVLASSIGEEQAGSLLSNPQLLELARSNQATGAWVVVRGSAALVVAAPVLAPTAIGWVVLGFPVNPAKARQLAELTGLEITVLSGGKARNATAGWRIDASSLPDLTLDSLQPLLQGVSRREVKINGESYLSQSVPLGSDAASQVTLVMQNSIDRAFAPYRQLRNRIALVLLVGMALAVFGSRWLSKKITSPIDRLVEAARHIGGGDYSQKVPVDSNDEVGQLASSFNVMTGAVAEREERIRYLAYHDGLTQLPNYKQLGMVGDALIALAEREDRTVAVFKMDIDRFRLINESLGYEIGNAVLLAVTGRMRELLRDSDCLARQGGNEFALLLPSLTEDKAQAMFKRLTHAFEQPLAVEGESIDIQFSVGCALFPDHGASISELLQKAEVAMYIAKRLGTGLAIYDPRLEENARVKLSLLGELRQALEADGQLMIYLQPKVNLANGRVTQAEALIRWRHPQRGFMSPAEFIPFAEQTGRISELTRWILRKVVHTLVHWRSAFDRNVCISVNVSTRDIQDPNFPEFVHALLSEHACPPELLYLEITESGVMADAHTALATLSTLHAYGVPLSIDDFGTGYSSLSYLKRMPIQELKIDRSFVSGTLEHSEAAVLLRSTVELGHNLGLKVVAEGVETFEEWQLVKALGCDAAQGYLIARPMPLPEFEAWLTRHAVYMPQEG